MTSTHEFVSTTPEASQDTKPGRRAVIAAAGVTALAGCSNESTPEPTTEPAPTTEAPVETEPADTGEVSFTPRWENVAYGDIEPGLSDDELKEAMKIPDGLSNQEIGEELTKRMNAVLMYGATNELMDDLYTLYNETPDEEEFMLARNEYIESVADRNVDAFIPAIFGENWQLEEDTYNTASGVAESLRTKIVENLFIYVTTQDSPAAQEAYSRQLSFIGIENDDGDDEFPMFDLVATVEDNFDATGLDASFGPVEPELANVGERRDYRVRIDTEELGVDNTVLRFYPLWSAGGEYDPNNPRALGEII